MATKMKCKTPGCDDPSTKRDGCCYAHCAAAGEPEGWEHVAGGYTATQADGTPFTVDFECSLCGQSGAAKINEDDIQWD